MTREIPFSNPHSQALTRIKWTPLGCRVLALPIRCRSLTLVVIRTLLASQAETFCWTSILRLELILSVPSTVLLIGYTQSMKWLQLSQLTKLQTKVCRRLLKRETTCVGPPGQAASIAKVWLVHSPIKLWATIRSRDPTLLISHLINHINQALTLISLTPQCLGWERTQGTLTLAAPNPLLRLAYRMVKY